jgi:membrane protease YdiL (CAAX protease family)
MPITQQAPKYLWITVLSKAFAFWIIFIVLLMLGGFLNNLFIPTIWHKLFYGIVGTIAAFAATYFLLSVNKQSFATYELIWNRKTVLNFLKGIALGAIIFGVMMVVLVASTALTIEKSDTIIGVSWLLATCHILPMAFMEELAFRGYPFLIIKNAFGLRAAQIIVALVFALYHIIQGWGVEIAFLGPGIWAFVFGLAAIYFKGIAVPTGIHFALNLGQDLLATKGNSNAAIWLVKQQNTTPAAVANTEMIGLIIQVAVLIMIILYTEWYIRKHKTANTLG